MEIITDIRLGDCKDVLKSYPTNFVDLIITSPPYADQRKNTYGGIHPDKYVEWFIPIADELLRVLKPIGKLIFAILFCYCFIDLILLSRPTFHKSSPLNRLFASSFKTIAA